MYLEAKRPSPNLKVRLTTIDVKGKKDFSWKKAPNFDFVVVDASIPRKRTVSNARFEFVSSSLRPNALRSAVQYFFVFN
jgi:hypothetical protein